MDVATRMLCKMRTYVVDDNLRLIRIIVVIRVRFERAIILDRARREVGVRFYKDFL